MIIVEFINSFAKHILCYLTTKIANSMVSHSHAKGLYNLKSKPPVITSQLVGIIKAIPVGVVALQDIYLVSHALVREDLGSSIRNSV